jgi:hypothetical protein
MEKLAEKWVWIVRGVAFPYVMGGHELSEMLLHLKLRKYWKAICYASVC